MIENIQVQSQLREEYGVIPMTAVPSPQDGVARIGAASGAVRLSSGYAFSTIQAQMATLANSIAAGRSPGAEALFKVTDIYG